MNVRNMLGFATCVVAATLVTGFALNMVAGVPTAAAREDGNAIDPDGGQPRGAPAAAGGAWYPKQEYRYVSHHEATRCEAHALLVASNQCNVDGDATAFSLGLGSLPIRDAQSAGGYGGYGGGKKVVKKEHAETTHCEAKALLVASNQCNVDGDATAFTFGPGLGPGPGPGPVPELPAVGGASAMGGGKYGGGKTVYKSERVETTECEALGLIASNQCNVDGDATAFTFRPDAAGGNGFDAEEAPMAWSLGGYGGGKKVHKEASWETTECEALGIVASNQCNVGGDAEAFALGPLGLGILDPFPRLGVPSV